MANIKINPNQRWTNFHQSIDENISQLAKVTNTSSGIAFDRYNECSEEIMRFINKCIIENRKVKAGGSKWSLTAINFSKDTYIDTSSMTMGISLTAPDLHQSYPLTYKHLCFAQCGLGIKQLSSFFDGKSKALKTSGASNGQTIAGAIGTGVHGSAHQFGSIQDSVVGLHIICNMDKAVYIEKASYPVTQDGFASKINATLIRNDELFNAALVSLGCFGFIHGVMVEAEDQYTLRTHIKDITYSHAQELMTTMDFANSDYPLPEPKNIEPCHLKFYINPYKINKAIIAEIIYKESYPPNYTSPHASTSVQKTINKDLLGIIASLAQSIPGLSSNFVNALVGKGFPKLTKPRGEVATLADTFWNTTTEGKSFSCAVGLPIEHSAEALEIFKQLITDYGEIASVFSMRFVKKSEALLAFTQFPITAILEVDGARNSNNENYVKLIPQALKNANIPFTFHWGKDNPVDKNLTQHMYGNNYNRWLQQRSALLTQQEADAFRSDYTDNMGLGDYIVGVSPIIT